VSGSAGRSVRPRRSGARPNAARNVSGSEDHNPGRPDD
jgi:hypothetical protein